MTKLFWNTGGEYHTYKWYAPLWLPLPTYDLLYHR